MAYLDQVIAQIRFQLAQLTAKNGHHDFEHLCRHLARAKICSNIIPATGPVSAGGDQGKDFETVRTFLDPSASPSSVFLGLATDKNITFACSLEQSIEGKIRSDVFKIADKDPTTNFIYFFCTADIPIAKRQALKAWAKDQSHTKKSTRTKKATHPKKPPNPSKAFSVDLEILDGQAISEWLADADVFWIAERFLGIPGELFPRRQQPNWYENTLERWQSAIDFHISFAEFNEVREAARHAAQEPTAKNDLSLWLELLERFATDSRSPILQRLSTYELALTHLRGRGTLDGQEERLRKHFSYIQSLQATSEAEDMATLLGFCIGATLANATSLSAVEVANWHAALTTKLDDLITSSPGPSTRCALLEQRGFLA